MTTQRHLLSRRSLDRYLNAPLSFDMETQIKKVKKNRLDPIGTESENETPLIG